MIKLFLFTLLCAAVFADSPFDVMNQTWKYGQEMMDIAQKHAQHAEDFMNHGHPLVRRMAQDMEPPKGPPPGPPPKSSGQDSSLVRRAAQDMEPPKGPPGPPGPQPKSSKQDSSLVRRAAQELPSLPTGPPKSMIDSTKQ